ncbi:U3-containing 90S pre-ribosomal complex subunit-domain containing protein [Hygrophoropsis aurantiaca]|uniref:U3-containing 90S pre-ribosomal complex subunit-domain containing protein n=1 Tax=Hygrophoropsis aurantiaca TaxID=72124 RepID=A0ACB8ATB5_9AGAM|nr:U3-containing 90S pre-ribosomal complex subunit-domain containing protein [Hygrophoropsis aurantiaca]
MNQQRGDDLDDDFVPDELVASSGEEEEAGNSNAPPKDGIEALLSADEDADSEEAERKGREAAQKKRKKREKGKERNAKKRKLAQPADDAEPASVAAQPTHKLADFMSSFQAKAFPAMSSLELEDMLIPETSMVDTTSWTGSRSLDQLVEFITEVLPMLHTRLSQKSKSSGAPTLLFIAGAALRVVDVTRVLKDKRLRGDKGGDVAKLFAKHFKLGDHVSYLKRTKIGAAVGTPGRVGKLLCETDALSLSQLTHIILDISFRDAKKRSLFDIPETRDEVFRTVLGAPKVVEGIKQGKIQVVLF